MKKVTVKTYVRKKKKGGASVVKTHQSSRKEAKAKPVSIPEKKPAKVVPTKKSKDVNPYGVFNDKDMKFLADMSKMHHDGRRSTRRANKLDRMLSDLLMGHKMTKGF